MKKLFLVLSVVICSMLLFSGCKQRSEMEKTEKAVTSEDVKRETGEALETTKEFVEQEKEEYMKKLESKLNEYDKEIEKLEAKAKEMKEEARKELDKEIKELKQKREAARNKLEEMKTASGKAWEDIKSGMDKEIDDIGEAIRKTSRHFK